MPDEPTLHNVIEHCKLAILLTCCDRGLLSDYLSGLSQVQPFPDLLTCESETIDVWTVEIYMVLLMNILDSLLNIPDSHNDRHTQEHIPITQDVVYQKIRDTIIRIFEL